MANDLRGKDYKEKQEPYVEIDGGFLRCPNCWTEIKPNNIGGERCVKCGQFFDWKDFNINRGR